MLKRLANLDTPSRRSAIMHLALLSAVPEDEERKHFIRMIWGAGRYRGRTKLARYLHLPAASEKPRAQRVLRRFDELRRLIGDAAKKGIAVEDLTDLLLPAASRRPQPCTCEHVHCVRRGPTRYEDCPWLVARGHDFRHPCLVDRGAHVLAEATCSCAHCHCHSCGAGVAMSNWLAAPLLSIDDRISPLLERVTSVHGLICDDCLRAPVQEV